MCDSIRTARNVGVTMTLPEIRDELSKLIQMTDHSKRFVGLVQLRQKVTEAITPVPKR